MSIDDEARLQIDVDFLKTMRFTLYLTSVFVKFSSSIKFNNLLGY